MHDRARQLGCNLSWTATRVPSRGGSNVRDRRVKCRTQPIDVRRGSRTVRADCVDVLCGAVQQQQQQCSAWEKRNRCVRVQCYTSNYCGFETVCCTSPAVYDRVVLFLLAPLDMRLRPACHLGVACLGATSRPGRVALSCCCHRQSLTPLTGINHSDHATHLTYSALLPYARSNVSWLRRLRCDLSLRGRSVNNCTVCPGVVCYST